MPYPFVNRSVLIVTPLQPFAEWLEAVDSQLPEEEQTPTTLDELQADPTAYLVPALQEDEDPNDLLDDLWEDIFIQELSGWYEDEELWPGPLTPELFDEWFDVRLHTLTVDVSGEPLLADEEE